MFDHIDLILPNIIILFNTILYFVQLITNYYIHCFGHLYFLRFILSSDV